MWCMVAGYLNAVELNDVWVRYGSKTVLEAVTHVFKTRSSTALLGRNGAGKTTLLRAMVGLVSPYRGSIRVFGRPAGTVDAKALIGYLPERPGVYDRLTAMENMVFHGVLNGLDRDAAHSRATRLLDLFGLSGVASERVSTFSKGMRQRLALARTLFTDPPLLLLDEPTSGLDPDGSDLAVKVLREHVDRGATLIVSTHNPYFARRLCVDTIIVDSGRIAASGNIDSLVFCGKVRVRLLEPAPIMVIKNALGLGDGVNPVSVAAADLVSDFELTMSGAEHVARIVESLVKAGLKPIGVEPIESLPKSLGGDDA